MSLLQTKPAPRVSRIAGFFATLAGLALLVCAGIGGWFYISQEKLIFHPSTLPPSHQFTLPNVSEVSVPVEGATLSAMHFRHPDSKGLVFFLHGNGGTLATWLRSTDFYRNNRFDVFMIDYRGYGKSTGKIESEAQLHADVRAAWDRIAPQYAGKPRVIFGRSLGTTLAAKLSADVQPEQTFLISPFFNLNAMREDHYRYLPRFLMRYTFATNEWLPKIKTPVTILHGEIDGLINISHAERLRATSPRVELVKIRGGDHNNLQELPEYNGALSERLAKL
jgi:uncharacterized protein